MKKEKYITKELRIGTKIELEHTRFRKVAEKITKDHLREFPRYYTRGILPMEKRLKKLSKLKKGGKE